MISDRKCPMCQRAFASILDYPVVKVLSITRNPIPIFVEHASFTHVSHDEFNAIYPGRELKVSHAGTDKTDIHYVLRHDGFIYRRKSDSSGYYYIKSVDIIEYVISLMGDADRMFDIFSIHIGKSIKIDILREMFPSHYVFKLHHISEHKFNLMLYVVSAKLGFTDVHSPVFSYAIVELEGRIMNI